MREIKSFWQWFFDSGSVGSKAMVVVEFAPVASNRRIRHTVLLNNGLEGFQSIGDGDQVDVALVVVPQHVGQRHNSGPQL